MLVSIMTKNCLVGVAQIKIISLNLAARYCSSGKHGKKYLVPFDSTKLP